MASPEPYVLGYPLGEYDAKVSAATLSTTTYITKPPSRRPFFHPFLRSVPHPRLPNHPRDHRYFDQATKPHQNHHAGTMSLEAELLALAGDSDSDDDIKSGSPARAPPSVSSPKKRSRAPAKRSRKKPRRDDDDSDDDDEE